MQLREQVAKRLRGLKTWAGLLEEFEKEVERVEGKENRAAALFELGEVCEEIFLRKDRAMAHYQQAFKQNPQQIRALTRARQIYREMGNLEMVATLLGLEMKVSTDPARKSEAERMLGEILLDAQQRDRAKTALENAAKRQPGDSDIADALAATQYDREDWNGEVDRLLAQAQRVSANDAALAARVYLRAARILHLEAATDPRLEQALRNVVALAPQQEMANFLLEKTLAAQNRFDDIVALQDQRIDSLEDAQAQIDLAKRIGNMWLLRWKDRDRAAHFYGRALLSTYAGSVDAAQAFAGHLAAFSLLRDVMAPRAEWPQLLSYAELGRSALMGDEERGALMVQAARIAWREMADPERARGYYAEVMRVFPENDELQAYVAEFGDPTIEPAAPEGEAVAGAEGEVPVEPVAEVPAEEAPVEAVPPAESEPAAVTAEETAPPAAEEVPAEEAAPVAQAEPAVDAAAEAAPPIAQEEPAAEPVAEEPPAAEPAAEAAVPDEYAGLDPAVRAAMDAAWALEGSSLDKAIDAWRKVVAQAPTHRVPRREHIRVLRQAEKWNGLADALKEFADKVADLSADEKVEALFELVAIYKDRLRIDSQVVNTYNTILTIQPGNVAALDALAAQYENMKRWPDLISTLQKKASQIEDVPEKVALYCRVARLFQERFSNVAEAIKAYEQALALDDGNAEAINYLKSNYEKRRDWEKLIAVNQREISRIPNANERGQRFVEIAKMASEKLKKPAVSIELWERVLEANPDHVEALGELEKLYEREKMWDKLADVSERQVALFNDNAKKVAMLQKLGVLFTDRVKDGPRATNAWRQLLAIEPENRRAQDAIKKLFVEQKSWDDLEQFYAKQNKFDELIRTFERQVDVEDDANKVLLYNRIAVLYRDKMGKADRALRAFEAVLKLDARNLMAAEALIPLYEGAKDPKKLASVLEIQLSHTEDLATRVERMQKLAELTETSLKDKGTAYSWYLKGFGEDHRADWLRPEIERLAAETGGWAQLVAAYEAAVPKFTDKMESLPLLLVVAKIYEEQMQNADKAIETNRQILSIDENNAIALEAMERLYLKTGRYTELLSIYQKKLDLEMDPARQKGIRYQIAQLYENEIKDPGQAVTAYRAILDGVGGENELAAWQALDRIYTATAQWAELQATIPRELELVDPADAATIVELKYRLGQIREQHLSDVPGAIECYREILELAPAHSGAREALERRLGDQDFQVEAANILQPIYEQLGEWLKLIEVHEIQLKRTDEVEILTRVTLLMRIGELWAQQVGNGEKAFDAYSRCFRLDPANEQCRAQLDALAAHLGFWSHFVALYEEAIEKGGLESLLTRELLMRVAVVYDEHLGKSDKAVEFFRRAQAIDPEDTVVLEALEKLYQGHQQWNELLEVFRKKVEIATDPKIREGMFFRMAKLWEEVLGNYEQAINTYKEVLAQDDSNIDALRSLDRLFVQQKMWTDLSENLQRQLVLTQEQVDTVPILVRLAALRESELSELAAAVDTYRQVLEIDAANEAATVALERLIKLPDHELNVATILEPIYKQINDWAKLVFVYEIMVKHSLDPLRKIELLHEIARLYEEGGENGVEAFNTFARALREDPTRDDTQKQLERLARQLERWQDLVNLYGEVVEQAGHDVELQVHLWTRIAQIYEQNLGNTDKSAEAYHRVIKVDERNLPAANSLESLYRRTENYQKLVEVVQLKVGMVEEVADKKALYFQAARLYVEVLQSPDKSIEVYKGVLETDPNDTTAINSLERLFIDLERWGDLKDIFARKVDLAQTVEDKKRVLNQMGEVYETKLNDVEHAIETYSGILDLDPTDWTAISALDHLYLTAQRWYDLLQILEREVELSGTSAETVVFKYRIGELYQTQLKDMAQAVESYRQALELDSTHEPTLAALDTIVHGAEEPVAAANVLEPVFETAGEWEKLIDVLEVKVKHADDALAKVELLHRIAGYYERQLERSPSAFEAFSRALALDSQNESTIQNLERLAEVTKAWPKLASLYEAEIVKMQDVLQQVEMLLRTARVYEEEMQAEDKAIATFRRVLDVEAENPNAVLALDRLYERGQHWKELTDVLRTEIRMANSDQEIVALQFRLGQTFEQQLHDVDSAIEVYREILTSDPNHGPTLQALELLFAENVKPIEIAGILEPLYRVAEQWEKLVKIHEVQLDKLTDEAERQALIQRIAEICEHKLMDQVTAFQWWCRAISEAPTSEMAGEEVERLARVVRTWEELVQVYSDTLQGDIARRDAAVQRLLFLKVARVFEFELRDLQRAEEAHLNVLKIDSKDAEALAALDRIYAQLSMWPELADILARRIQITPETDDRIELYFRLGKVYTDALESPENAIKCYLAILEDDTRNGKALECLERIYFRGERWRELFGVYEKMVDIADGDAGMADCYARMARIASDALNERDKSIELWNKVIDLRGEDPMALGQLAGLYETAQMWRELVDVLERTVRITEIPEDRIPFFKRLGPIWEVKLERDRESLDAWNEILQIDSRDIDALRATAALYRKLQQPDDLVDTLHRLIEAGQLQNMSIEEIREAYAELGKLYAEQLMRPNDAIDSWRKVFEYNKKDFRALAALEKLFGEEARWEDAVDVIEKRIKLLDSPADKISELIKAAKIWEDNVSDAAAAADAYERVLQIDKHNLTASVALENIYRARGSWNQLSELLLARVEFPNFTPHQRIEAYQAIARIYEDNMNDRESAFVVLQAAFREDYSVDSTARELERLASITGKWGDLLGEYTQSVQQLADMKARADLWVKIGRWYNEHLGRVDYAIASQQQALAIDPNLKEALTNLAECYRKTQQWQELIQVLEHHSNVEDDVPKKVDILVELAERYENQLGNTSNAIGAYRRAIAADPAAMQALDNLERLYLAGQQWVDLIDILGRKAQIIDDQEKVITLKRRIAEYYDQKLQEPKKAIVSQKEILDIDAANLRAMRALEDLYGRTSQAEPYLQILEAQLDVVATDDDRISVYERIAQAWENLFKKLEKASETYEKVLTIDERHTPSLKQLERLYRLQQKWAELVDTYRRHIMAVPDAGDRMALYALMGEVYEVEIKDLDRAVEAYSDILSFDPNHQQALNALGRLYEKVEDWNRAIDTLAHLVSLVSDRAKQVDLHTRVGALYEDRMQDQDTAEGRYLEALRIDGNYVPALLKLIALYKGRGDWLKAVQYMIRCEEQLANQKEKVNMLFEIGTIFRERLDDEPKSAEFLARVIALDPEHVGAAEPLSDVYFQQQRWKELEPILDMLVRKADKRDAKETNQLYFRLAKTADSLGNRDKALKYYKMAYDLDSTSLQTLLGRADLLYRIEDWEGAFKLYQTVLVHHREGQKDSEVVDIFYRLGVIKLKQGEKKKALNMFEKALEIDANHRPTLLAVIDMQSAQNDWEAVINAKRALLPVSETDEKFKLNCEMAELYTDKLQKYNEAIKCYTDAVELKPESHVVLHKVLDLYTKTEQWKKAIEVLHRIAGIEKDNLRRGKFFYTAGVIFRDALKATDEAIDQFNSSLDAYFENPDRIPKEQFQTYLKPFEAIDKLCTNRKDWKAQERNYRKMIKRMPKTGQEQYTVALWHALGEIYRSRLRDINAAIQTFEVACQLEPDNLKRHEILAELYMVAGPDMLDKAINEQMFLISKDPFKIEAYKNLRKIYMDARQYDRAWCMCSALTYLQRADAEEQQFFEQYKSKGLVRAKAKLTDEMWAKYLYHPDEDRFVGNIYAAVYMAVGMMKSGEHKQYNLKRKERRDLATDQAMFSKVFTYVMQVLNVPPNIEIFFRPEQQGELQVANCREKLQFIPSIVVGGSMLSGRSDKDMAFPIASFLTKMRPEHYLRQIIPTNTELSVAVMAAIRMVAPQFNIPPDKIQLVEQYILALRQYLPQAAQEHLHMVVQRFVQQKSQLDMAKWAQAVDLTSHRAGLIISNDLSLAARFIGQEPITVGGMQPKDKVKELLMYAISPAYFELRNLLGIAIG